MRGRRRGRHVKGKVQSAMHKEGTNRKSTNTQPKGDRSEGKKRGKRVKRERVVQTGKGLRGAQ